MLPVPLNSSKITSSILEPVSTSEVAIIVNGKLIVEGNTHELLTSDTDVEIAVDNVSKASDVVEKLGKDIVKRKLEDKEREITLKLEDVNFNINKVQNSIKLIGESEVLSTALTNLEKRKSNLDKELQATKELQYKERVKL